MTVTVTVWLSDADGSVGAERCGNRQSLTFKACHISISVNAALTYTVISESINPLALTTQRTLKAPFYAQNAVLCGTDSEKACPGASLQYRETELNTMNSQEMPMPP